MIKHFVPILLAGLLLALCLCACGPKTDDTETGKPSNETVAETAAQTEGEGAKETIKVTLSYSRGAEDFKKASGFTLPEISDLEVEEFPYTEGATDYCFDITGGMNLNFSTYETILAYFQEQLGECQTGFPDGDESTGMDAQWTLTDGRWYQVYWDSANQAIYINTRVIEK